MFKSKDHVVCVDDSKLMPIAPMIKKGEIYQLEAIITCSCGYSAVCIEGKYGFHAKWECFCGNTHDNYGLQPYKSERFRAIDDDYVSEFVENLEEDSISELEEILKIEEVYA